jgi:sigma-E factor negative regulatory protein RseA
MNDATHEQLSALVDGELKRDELRFLLRRVDSDAELARRWSRYQIASSVLKRQYVAPACGEEFVAGVFSRLETREPMPAAQPLGGRLLRWAGGGAIAAAVAVIALVSVRPAAVDQAAPGSASIAALSAATAPAAPVGELHQPLPQQVLPAGLIDYAQPASYESIVPNYATLARYPAGQLVSGSNAEGFVPYVLVVGSRQAHDQDQPDGRRRDLPARNQ